MKEIALLFLMLFQVSSVKAQNEEKKSLFDFHKTELLNEYHYGGLKADSLAEQCFKEDYERATFERFKGKVIIDNGNTFRYENKIIEITNSNYKLWAILSKGIFHPNIINEARDLEIERKGEAYRIAFEKSDLYYYNTRTDSLLITELEELKMSDVSPKSKRFRFLLFREGFQSPSVCLIELTNENANQTTALDLFLNDSKLTFFIEAWIIL